MHPPTLNILLRAEVSDGLLARLAALAPGSRILTGKDLQDDPGLIAEADVCLGRLTAEQFSRAGRLKWLQCYSAGMDWAQNQAARSHPAVLTNARIHAAPISEHVFGMLLMLAHRLHLAHEHKLAGRWQRPDIERVAVLEGKTLCVLGLGVIGRRCARLGKAFGMRVVGVRRSGRPTPNVAEVFTPERLHDALAEADVVMNILPGTGATAGMVDAAAFSAMKRGAVFLNAGRGGTVDTAALVEALRQGQLAGACLDVTDPEPLPAGHPLWAMPNVLITAHYSGTHPGYDGKVEALFLDNLRRFLGGRPLRNVVDKQEGY